MKQLKPVDNDRWEALVDGEWMSMDNDSVGAIGSANRSGQCSWGYHDFSTGGYQSCGSIAVKDGTLRRRPPEKDEWEASWLTRPGWNDLYEPNRIIADENGYRYQGLGCDTIDTIVSTYSNPPTLRRKNNVQDKSSEPEELIVEKEEIKFGDNDHWEWRVSTNHSEWYALTEHHAKDLGLPRNSVWHGYGDTPKRYSVGENTLRRRPPEKDEWQCLDVTGKWDVVFNPTGIIATEWGYYYSGTSDPHRVQGSGRDYATYLLGTAELGTTPPTLRRKVEALTEEIEPKPSTEPGEPQKMEPGDLLGLPTRAVEAPSDQPKIQWHFYNKSERTWNPIPSHKQGDVYCIGGEWYYTSIKQRTYSTLAGTLWNGMSDKVNNPRCLVPPEQPEENEGPAPELNEDETVDRVDSPSLPWWAANKDNHQVMRHLTIEESTIKSGDMVWDRVTGEGPFVVAWPSRACPGHVCLWSGIGSPSQNPAKNGFSFQRPVVGLTTINPNPQAQDAPIPTYRVVLFCFFALAISFAAGYGLPFLFKHLIF